MKRKIAYILAILLCVNFTGCSKKIDSNKSTKTESISIVTTQNITIEKDISSEEEETSEAVPEMEVVDYSNCYDEIEGCAVFYHYNTNVYSMYNEELCKDRSSPNSTFKIISTLIGLENGVMDSADSTMGYGGTIYSNNKWNKDLSLKDAFKESCVWYYRKVIDQIGQSQVQKWLDKLEYGNCDISEWDGNGMNLLPELNGFWLDSSLEISPKEQVDVIADIYEGKTDFSVKNIKILKDVMLTQKNEMVSVYGKTGTGINSNGNMGNGWFVGMFENNDGRYYFAVHLTDEESKEAWGPKAKEIALNIIDKYYVN